MSDNISECSIKAISTIQKLNKGKRNICLDNLILPIYSYIPEKFFFFCPPT